MSKENSILDTVDQIVSDGVKRNILHLYNEDEHLVGNVLHLNGIAAVNFGSCSYLGLEFDDRLKDGACAAVRNYGTQFSESRAYVSLKLYRVLEEKFERLFGSPVVITPTTTLGHMACIPVLVDKKDAVILDHQVHNSVQTAVKIVKSGGTHVELVRHNRLDLLEERILQLRQHHSKIWYMADGIYSMFGDTCPVKEIIHLMDKYPELHFYVDDAHGMSVFGENGKGYVLSQTKIHPKMVVATSLAKAFATGGAVLIFPDLTMARKVRTCGGPMITSGPIQPATLGAAIASADIHLSNEIHEMQSDLKDRIKFTRLLLEKSGLPVISHESSPVFFIPVSLPKIGYGLIEKMLQSGYYLNLGIFPAVPIKNTGIRFTITRLHSFSQLENMVKNLSLHFYSMLETENYSVDEILKAFRISAASGEAQKLPGRNAASVSVKKTIYNSIGDIDKELWDSVMGGKGNFDYEAMKFLETSFQHNTLPEDNWEFCYLIVKDADDKIILATFFTICLWKEDMLSPHEVSLLVEKKRINNPYLYTSKLLMCGTLFSEGQHLYFNAGSPAIKEAFTVFFKTISELQEKTESSAVLIRDFDSGNEKLDRTFIDEGFFKLNMPDNHKIKWEGKFELESYVAKLSQKSRKHFRQDILRHENKFEFRICTESTEEEIQHWYNLYLNVKNRSYELNTFTLPFKLFREMAINPNWQISTLQLKSDGSEAKKNLPVAVMFTYLSGTSANFMLIGLDYTYQRELHCYRQALYRVIRYNLESGHSIHLGFAASFEKKKLGAEIIPTCAYMQLKDNYSMQVLSEMTAQKTEIEV